MPLSQLPLLIALLVALAVVVVLIIRQLRASPEAAEPVARARIDPPASSQPAAPPPPAASAQSAGTATAPAPSPTRTSASARVSAPTGAITSWGYQLQNLDIDAAARTNFDLLVIDTTLDGSDETALAPADLARLQRKPDGNRRRILAYLSIGEAESYRSYWDKRWKRQKPDWLLGENPEWKENYAVCFWHPGWQSVMCGTPEARLDRILAAGFDGVYLDKCDVFDDLKHRYKAEAASRPDLEGDMVQFVGTLANYAKTRRPGFMVVMQNAEELLDRADLRGHLDGIAKEELVYGCDGPERLNAKGDFDDSREKLDLMRAAGKPVFVVEYLDDPKKIAHATDTVAGLGYVLYVSAKNRNLDRLEDQVLTA